MLKMYDTANILRLLYYSLLLLLLAVCGCNMLFSVTVYTQHVNSTRFTDPHTRLNCPLLLVMF